jgi:hypothetical protein
MNPQVALDPRRNAQHAQGPGGARVLHRRAQLVRQRYLSKGDLAGVSLASRDGMRQKSVEIVIGRLATDEALRTRFSRDPQSTLRGLHEAGLELNPGEFEALLQMPAELLDSLAGWVHPRLQKIAFEGECHES